MSILNGLAIVFVGLPAGIWGLFYLNRAVADHPFDDEAGQ
jgi:hypothetical protein